MRTELKAWEPWHDALAAYQELYRHESPGEFKHWRIYWLAGITALRAIGHVLQNVDAKNSSLHKQLNRDLWNWLSRAQEPIFVEFIKGERDSLLKTYQTGVIPSRHTVAGWQDRGLAYEEIVSRNGEFVSLNWTEEGDCALRLFWIALQWWEYRLRAYEQALIENDNAAFRSGDRRIWELATANFKERELQSYTY